MRVASIVHGGAERRLGVAAGFKAVADPDEVDLDLGLIEEPEERLDLIQCGCVNLRFRWVAAAVAALLVLGMLQVKSAYGFPRIFTSTGTKTAVIKKAEVETWEEIPGMDRIIQRAESLRPPQHLRNLTQLFYSGRPEELGWVRTECVIDTIQATAYLGQAIVFLYKAIDYEPFKCPTSFPSGCAASVAGFVASLSWVASYLSFAANACGQAVNGGAICAGDWAALMANFGEIAFASAAVKKDCKTGHSTLDILIGNWHHHRIIHPWVYFVPAAAGPRETAKLVLQIKANRTQHRNRAFDITQCVMDVVNMLSFIVRALLQVRVAAASCPQPRACAIDIMNVISTFMWISRFTALAITDCSVGGSRKALCAADISTMIAAVLSGPAAGLATPSDCRDRKSIQDLAVVADPTTSTSYSLPPGLAVNPAGELAS